MRTDPMRRLPFVALFLLALALALCACTARGDMRDGIVELEATPLGELFSPCKPPEPDRPDGMPGPATAQKMRKAAEKAAEAPSP